MSALKAQLQEAVKQAMRDKAKARLGTIRLAMSAIKQIEVDERKELSDEEVLQVLDKMVKQRRESIKQYNDGGRPELAEIEQAEIVILQEFLPAQLTDDEQDALIEQAIADTGAASIKDMGKLMGALRGQVQGRVDMGPFSAKIKSKLA